MTEEKKASFVFPRLQLAYMLQFAIWGSWAVALGGYLNGKMTGPEIGYLFMAIPLGAIIAPMFIGPIADRFFAAQKVLGLLHLISGACLAGCGWVCLQAQQATAAGATVTVPFWPMMILLLISGICFMPSIPLINTVVFKHIPDSASTPKVFIFGTVGWILVNLIVAVFAGGAAQPYFFFIGGGCGIFLGLYSFTLPDTPPRGAVAGEKRDVFGLGALSMFKSGSFTLFVLCAFMVSIFGSNFFFPAIVPYLSEYGYPAPVALTTLNQFSELFFMAALAFCVARFGLKWVLVLGMSAWALRYIIFTQSGFQWALAGLLLHGLAYAFLYTAAYMFADRVAPANLKASVQSLLAFLLLGVGQVLSGFFFGFQFDNCPPELAKVPQSEKKIPEWVDPASETSGLRYLDLAKSVGFYFAPEEKKADWWKIGDNLGKYETANKTLDMDKLFANGEEVTFGDVTYTREEIQSVLTEVASKTGKTADTVTRDDWLSVQRHNWKQFFLWPAAFVIFWVVLFVLFGREPKAAVAEGEESGQGKEPEVASA
ncbi:MAG: MFS transporter [Planctomycetia bacterium]|nr:MFS transporter [Planctomycetia bacterium]